ncbi:hypothetical protein C8R44DRAFT_750509 [Mycena epipterygia]|nr:hypothetical protein C8R44DRAFT_750509 [Mycena epipterygia]
MTAIVGCRSLSFARCCTSSASLRCCRCLRSSCPCSPSGGGLGVIPSGNVERTGLVSLVCDDVPSDESSLPSVQCRSPASASARVFRRRSLQSTPSYQTPLLAQLVHDVVERLAGGAGTGGGGARVVCLRGVERAFNDDAAHDVAERGEEDGAHSARVGGVRGLVALVREGAAVLRLLAGRRDGRLSKVDGFDGCICVWDGKSG